MALTSRLSRVFPRRAPSTATPARAPSRTRTPGPTTPTARAFTQSLSAPVQIYRSTSTDPYLNLSIEHHLLQHSDPASTILFLYANRPTVVIGRNQNPWLEVNLHQLRQGLGPPLQSPSPSPSSPAGGQTAQQQEDASPGTNAAPIALVRRRSGGGTVFHDAGNVNYSVICPPAVFDRDRHAEMVVRALRRLGVLRARVNGRHDIVVDVGGEGGIDGDGGRTGGGVQTFKVSGSAYKLTRTRSLHHGTCLLSSPNLGRVSGLLRSPAEGFIKARGVESVRSPICNVGVGADAFVEAVVREFRTMYGHGTARTQVVGEEEALATEGVVKGVRELTTPEWIFGQTPQFTFSTCPTEDDARERPPSVDDLPDGFQANFTVRHGEITSAAVSGLEYHDLTRQRLHYIQDWKRTLARASPTPVDTDVAGDWLNHMFGIETAADKASGAVAEMAVGMISDSIVGSIRDGDGTP
ncbi:hypothetical protein BT67DRAFT_377023 [Trichocladium antarcticum]|uniref:Putative lipoate-protein ligase A n=1 Tax=Trichocladium antarcticum TaxID=1450529 RepID=A0AAN6UME1_9PEZI|nr:hypothetical protein BT67DRAFT_377023 [Trichocladium antarcticum]